MCLVRPLLKTFARMPRWQFLIAFQLVPFLSWWKNLWRHELVILFLVFYHFLFLYCIEHLGQECSIRDNIKAHLGAGLLTSKILCLVESLLQYRLVHNYIYILIYYHQIYLSSWIHRNYVYSSDRRLIMILFSEVYRKCSNMYIKDWNKCKVALHGLSLYQVYTRACSVLLICCSLIVKLNAHEIIWLHKLTILLNCHMFTTCE